MYDTEKRIELVKKLSFTVAVVITALCIKFRNRGQKSQDAEDCISICAMRKKSSFCQNNYCGVEQA